LNTEITHRGLPEEQHPPKVKVVDGSVVPKDVSPEGIEAFIRAARAVTGVNSDDLAIILVNQLVHAQGKIEDGSELKLNAALAALAEHKPVDVCEAMLASQMVAIHAQCMSLLARSAGTFHLESQQQYTNLALKLSRVFALQMETFRKYRQKGQQKMTVEHVHVHQGGQAIVGNVTNQGGGDNV